MVNAIIVIILVIAIILGVKETIRHFKGEGACCGGTTAKPKRKKLKNKIVHVYSFRIEGMKCQNCANEVIRAVNEIQGASAKVLLHKKMAKVSCDKEIAPQIIEEAIQKRGYHAYFISIS